jgi:SNF2 family DNA or RNA helicase
MTRGGVKTWAIECEPHVAIRLKRVFGKVNRGDFGTIYVSHTPENCRDLEWFFERYPLVVADANALTLAAEKQRDVESAVMGLMDGTYQPPNFDLALPLRDYQKIPPSVVLRTGGVLLADDVGVGKTAMAIGILTDPRTLPALVVTLTDLPRQWEDEIARFAPRLRVRIPKTGNPSKTDVGTKKQAMMFSEFPDVTILNYHKLAGWSEALSGIVKSVIFDEAHELRHTGSLKYNAAKHVASKAAFRMGLTATPIFNYGSEIYPVLNVIRPNVLGTHDEFLREWCEGRVDDKGRAKIKDPKAFGTYARESGLMIRRTRAEVGRELPSLTRVPHYVDADTNALDRVGASAAELARIILRQGETHRGAKMEASREFDIILRQATGIAKAPFVADFVRLLVESGESVLLFGWHREVYSIWNDRLGDLNPVMYTGSESTTQKQAARDAFVEKRAKVLIMSLRAGAGLDGLQSACRTTVHGELDWSPGVHEQNTGRIYRDGQSDPVTSYFLISDHGTDPMMVDVLGLKRQQIEGLRDPYAAAVTQAESTEGHVRRLAEDFLKRRGEEITEGAAWPRDQAP